MTFDPQSLFDAVDAQRRQRGMTWQKLSDELGVSASTIRQMPKRRWGIELDGGAPPLSGRSQRRRPLRFQTKELFVALDGKRASKAMTWDDVAAEIWPSGPWGARQLTRLSDGGRIDVQSALNACQWLGRTIQSFQRETWP